VNASSPDVRLRAIIADGDDVAVAPPVTGARRRCRLLGRNAGLL
jgi:hypothetical protein